MIPFTLLNTMQVLSTIENIGWDGSDGTTIFKLFFKVKFTSVSTTNVGIKVPIVSQISSSSLGLSTQTGLSLWNYNTVGDTPTWGSNSIYPPYNPPSQPIFYRSLWNVSSDSNYIYIWTSNSDAKSYLNTSDFFWIGIELRDTSGSPVYKAKITTYTNGTINARFIPYNSLQIGPYKSIIIYDYNT